MAALTAAEVKYAKPVKTSVGALWFAATLIEIPTTVEGIKEGELELNKEKLFGGSMGLSDEALGGLQTAATPVLALAGEAATTTPLPLMGWSSPLYEAKTSGEKGVACKKYVPTLLTVEKEKIILRMFQLVALKKPLSEITEAEKGEAGIEKCACTIYLFGK